MKKIIKGFLTILFLCLTVSSVSVNAANDDKGTWTRLADTNKTMLNSRTFVVLNNKIYNTNRVNNENVLEEYDSVSDKWLPKVNMTSYHRALTLEVLNNKLYAVCYSDNNKGGLIEEYDPQTNKWITKTKMDYSINGRTVVANNKIYLYNYCFNRLEEYDPQTNKYTIKSNIVFSVESSIVVVNNKIYVLGGRDSRNVYKYDSEADKWTVTANLSQNHQSSQVVVVNDKIYILGGYNGDSITNSIEEYNPETNKCSVKTSMSLKRYWFQAVVLNNKIYAIGGIYDNDSNGSKVSNTVEEYDPEVDIWTPKTNMNLARERFTALVKDTKIYAFGGHGQGNEKNVNTAEVFTQEIESKNSLNISLDKTSITLLEGETNTLTATITPKDSANKKIIWTSSDESIATVDANGNVTAVKKGQAKITAKIEGTDVSASCDVNVTTEGDGSSKPEISSNSGILSITLVNGITKDYDLSANEITKFTKWYDASNGKGQVRYGFNKKINPYKTVKEYIVFDKIASFEIREYNAEK